METVITYRGRTVTDGDIAQIRHLIANIAERVLKRAILNRKNSLFYKTDNGAKVGDRFLSIIHTTELANQNPFDYLVAVLRHADDAMNDPERWMLWNYTEAMAALDDPPSTHLD